MLVQVPLGIGDPASDLTGASLTQCGVILNELVPRLLTTQLRQGVDRRVRLAPGRPQECLGALYVRAPGYRSLEPGQGRLRHRNPSALHRAGRLVPVRDRVPRPVVNADV